jgi:hypothetical protein
MTNPLETDRKRTAHCCCGRLRVDTVGDPLIVVACSCEGCQRRTGSVLAISTYWLLENVEISGHSTRYVRDAQAGRKANYYFCSTCGSSVYWELPDRRPGQLGIARGSFFDVTIPSPAMSVWERSKHPWVSIPTSACFEQNPPPPEPTA